MSATRCAIPIACATWFAACAHGPPPPLHSTKLIVQSGGGNFRPFVRAKVAGESIALLVDTGAFDSVLPIKFVRDHNLTGQLRDSQRYSVDAHGHRVQMPLLPGVPVQFEGEATGGTLDFAVNPFTANEEAILSPQQIVRSGWALVIDLGGEELRYEPEPVALKRLGADASVPLREVDFHRCLHEGLFERTPHRIVSATVNGIAASMLVDTGASRTFLDRNNPALPSMLAMQGSRRGSQAMASFGQSLLVEDVNVVFSQTKFVLDIMVNPSSNICSQGALGADLLRQCTIVWGYSSLWAACRPLSKAEKQG